MDKTGNLFNKTVKLFNKGTHNVSDPEIIPDGAAKDSLNFVNKDGKVVLIGGRKSLGSEGVLGTTGGIWKGYKVDGTTVLYCKMGESIMYFDGSDWKDTGITGFSSTEDVTFANYSSLAGAFTFVSGLGGYWKLINAVPESPINIYNASKNFKGYILIDRGRTLLWNRDKDKTGIYGSWIDRQNSTVYTTVTGEAKAASGSGTLAFKAGGATRSCFAVTMTITDTGEVLTDNYLGVLTGNMGSTGTIDYATGAWTCTSTAAGTINYQWEDSTVKGVADFSKSSPRQAGEGFQFPQDEGGDAILKVEVGQDGAYYSLKKESSYRLEIDDDDTNATNEIYSKDMGLPYWRASLSSNKGIVFMNTSNPTNPEMTLLRRNKVSLEIEPVVLFSHFDFNKFDLDECSFGQYDRWILVFCKSKGAENNNRILLCNVDENTVSEIAYTGKTSVQDDNKLYIADSLTLSVYEIFSGFDDLGLPISAYWESKDDLLNTEDLKKIRRLRFKGLIDPDQTVDVFVDIDSGGYQKVGEIRGDGTYVNYNETQAIGSNFIGESQIGGDDITNAYGYYMEIKFNSGKFRKISLKFVPTGIGYFDFNLITFWNILPFEGRIPKSYRTKKI